MNITFRQLRVFTEVAQQGSWPARPRPAPDAAGGVDADQGAGGAGRPAAVRPRRAARCRCPPPASTSWSRAAPAGHAEGRRRRDGALQAAGARPADHRHGQHRQVLRAAAAGALPRRAPGRRRAAARGRQPRAAGGADAGRRGRPVGDGPRRRRRWPRAPSPSPRTRMVFVAPPGHPLLRGRQRCRSSALARYPFIVREHGSGTRTAMEQFFAEHRFEPRIAMEMSSNETIKQAVMAGMGLSFLSLHTMGLELRSGLLQLLDIEGTPVMRTWNIVHLQLEAAVAGGRGLPLLHARAGRGAPAGARHAAARPQPGLIPTCVSCARRASSLPRRCRHSAACRGSSRSRSRSCG